MEDPSDRWRQQRSWYIPLWIDRRDVTEYRFLRRAGTDPSATLASQLETRRLLAHEVYRVPEDLLDDVIRVRLADLT